MTLRRLLALLVFFSSALCSASAQDYLYATGSPVYSTAYPIDHGFVNVNNGEVHLEIPLATYKQRGDLVLDEKLTYDSRIWRIVQNGSSYSWQPNNVPNASGGWAFSSSGGSGTFTFFSSGGQDSTVPGCPTAAGAVPYTQYARWTWTDAGGTTHSFPSVNTLQYGQKPLLCSNYALPGISSGVGFASDGSGYSLHVSNYTTAVISGPHGILYYPRYASNPSFTPPGNVTDRNGNYWSTDANGNLVGTNGLAPVTASTSGNRTTYSVLGVNGVRNNYVVTMTTVNFSTAFQEPAVPEVSGSFAAIQSISLPDGSMYSFTYDSGTSPGHYGELTSMTLPTGGLVSFGWSNYLDSFNNVNRWLTGLGRDNATTYFTPTVISKCTSSAGCNESVNMQKPDGNSVLYTFNLDKAGLVAGSSWVSGVNTYQGSSSGGTLLTSTSTSYTYETQDTYYYQNGPSQVASNGSYEIPSALTQTVTLSDVGLSSQTTTTLDTLSGLPTDVKVWDFGVPASGAPTTDTVYSYGVLNFATGITVSDGAGNRISQNTYGYDEVTPSAAPSGLPNYTGVATSARGNQTSQHQWINTAGISLDSEMTYDAAGFMLSQTTLNGTTSFAPDSSDTYVTKTTQPTPNSGALIADQASYDASTGAVTSTIDENGKQTVYKAFDVFNRPKEIDYPDGGRTTFSYTSPRQSGTQQAMDVRANDTEFLADVYGRANRKDVGNGQSTNPYFETDTCYDANGRMSFQSYPYASGGFGNPPECANGTSIGGDSYTYDGLDRIKQVRHADGFIQQFNYRGRAVESIDENGVTKITQTDAFGRTTAVCEVSSSTNLPGSGSPVNCGLDYPSTGFLTTYAYNNANHTTMVTQGAQTRVFTTDSLGRPVSTQEPESGLTTYTYFYNSKGLLVTRVRPRANQASGARTTTNTQYDSLGRILDVTYSDGSPERVYVYDQSSGGAAANTVGRLAQAAASFPAGTAATSFTYDPMGRPNQTVTCLPGQCGTAAIPIGYVYDHVGNLTAEGGPSIGTISYSYDLTSNLASESVTPPNQATMPVLSNVQLGAYGPSSYQLGNGLYQVFQYDVDGRKDRGWTCRGSSQPQCTGGTDLYGYGLDMKGSQLTNSSDSIMNNYNNYQYDEFNRLKSLNGGAGGLSLSWVYDRYGNRWQQNGSGVGSAPQPQYSYNASNNRNTAYLYDDAGDVNNDVSNGYSYDADGNAVTNGPTRYYYDALGNRFEKIPASGDPTGYIYDAFGRQIEVVNGRTDALLETRLPLNGSPLALLSAGSSLSFEHTDWLGTVRAISNASGSFISTFLSLPFGDGFTANGTDVDTGHFADLERDASTGTDHAAARNYGEAGGRWMSPDPYLGSYTWSDPQTLNRYSYTLNNPLLLVDPSGLFTQGGGGGDGGLADLLAELVVDGIEDLFGLLGGGPSFDGSLAPRPFTMSTTGDIGADNVLRVNAYGFGYPPLSSGFNLNLPISSSAGSSNMVPSNPCSYRGRALPPSAYAAAGAASNISSHPLSFAADASKGWTGYLNAQPLSSGTVNQNAAYGNYVFGIYMQTAGLKLSQALAGANAFAAIRKLSNPGQYAGQQMDPNYPSLPTQNTANIRNGFNAQANGSTCHD